MSITREVHSIFPELIFHIKEPKADWTKPEYIKQCLNLKYRKNGNNWASVDSYILNRPEFKELKNKIQNELNNIIEGHYDKNLKDLQIYITQSWLNVNDDEDSHHSHNHPNSILSGVVYLNTSDNDNITFMNTNYNTRLITLLPPLEIKYPVEKGDILIFDSQLRHKVDQSKRKDKRISLAFNTFFKGCIGETQAFNELKLK